jgi:hypothetical protein
MKIVTYLFVFIIITTFIDLTHEINCTFSIDTDSSDQISKLSITSSIIYIKLSNETIDLGYYDYFLVSSKSLLLLR